MVDKGVIGMVEKFYSLVSGLFFMLYLGVSYIFSMISIVLWLKDYDTPEKDFVWEVITALNKGFVLCIILMFFLMIIISTSRVIQKYYPKD